MRHCIVEQGAVLTVDQGRHAGFAREALMSWCERHKVDYVFGLARNARLVKEIATELALAKSAAERTGTAARGATDMAPP